MATKRAKIKYTGYNTHRLNELDPYNAFEVALAGVMSEWLERNPNTLEQIIQNPNRKNAPLWIEEKKAALSAIQWLGTPVGQSFYEEAKKRAFGNMSEKELEAHWEQIREEIGGSAAIELKGTGRIIKAQ